MSKIGERVLAISHAKGDTVWIYGYGKYIGDEIPPKEAGGMNFGIPNPCILLDSGKKVFGCECWWGEAERAEKEIVRGRKTIEVDIDEDRKGIPPN